MAKIPPLFMGEFIRDYLHPNPTRKLEETFAVLGVQGNDKIVLCVSPGRVKHKEKRKLAQRIRQTSLTKMTRVSRLYMRMANAVLHEVDPALKIINIHTDFFDLLDPAVMDYLAPRVLFAGIFFKTSGYNIANLLTVELKRRHVPVLLAGVHPTLTGYDYIKGLFALHLTEYPDIKPTGTEVKKVFLKQSKESEALFVLRYWGLLEEVQQVEKKFKQTKQIEDLEKLNALLKMVHYSLDYTQIRHYRAQGQASNYDLFWGDALIQNATAICHGQMGSSLHEFYADLVSGKLQATDIIYPVIYGSVLQQDELPMLNYVPTWKEQQHYCRWLHLEVAPWRKWLSRYKRIECIQSQAGWLANKTQSKDTLLVLKEIEQLSNDGISIIGLCDEHSINITEKTLELFQGIIAYKKAGRINRKISFFVQADLNIGNDSPNMQKLRFVMRKAGVRYVISGITLDPVGSDYNVRMINNIHRSHLNIIGSFVVGNPGEDLSVLDDIYQFALHNDLEILHIGMRTAIPGTPDWYRSLAQGEISTYNFELYDGNNATLSYQKDFNQYCHTALCDMTRAYYSFPAILGRLTNKFKYINSREYGSRDFCSFWFDALIKDLLYWRLSRRGMTPRELYVYINE